jgi:hypothetical protein
MSQKVYQPLHTDDPSSKIPPGEKGDRKAQSPLLAHSTFFLISHPPRSQSHFQEISSCDTQEELIVCLERIRDLIKDNLANDELIDDPAEVVLDRLAVSLDWMLITVRPSH